MLVRAEAVAEDDGFRPLAADGQVEDLGEILVAAKSGELVLKGVSPGFWHKFQPIGV